ncbi:BREX system Lon protease-like protein BrxL [Thermoleptolyngbya oregonensis NK1-22]|uniref:BREX system Lon protease-like protein BrxL n=2 Tax=Thermoleptolyngbya TaxID=2303528 RepID=A0AA97BLT5_9CYAN|nr:BREX system Lon protease-like protein BrxL [Thermoleptolyngbya oregonensis NK1-22]
MTSYNSLTRPMSYDSDRIRQVFGNLCIDKTRLPSSGLTAAGVPSFVAEWLLDKIVPGNGALQQFEAEKINNFVSKAFPRKDDKNVILFKLTQGEVYKLIALLKVRVKLAANKGIIPDPMASIPVLNIHNCAIPISIVEQHEMLLRQGLWGKISLSLRSDGTPEIVDFDPFQCSAVDLSAYERARAQLTTDEWRDLMLCSMGYNPAHPRYTCNAKMWMLARLLPLVESNYHVMELAPKGTGKSYVYENVSNKVALVSGGKVTPSQLFINGSTKEIGLLGRHDVVVLDEIQSLTFEDPDEIIGPLKNYLASGRYNRAGFADIASDCSLVMLGNIELDAQLQPRNANNLLADLPSFLMETAFLDRFSGIIPGWEIPKFSREMAASQVGLKMDFFGEALLSLRRDNRYLTYAQQHTKFDYTSTVRDQNSILKSASGFLKILYPHLELTVADYERDCLFPALRLRHLIRNVLYRLDSEFESLGQSITVEVI